MTAKKVAIKVPLKVRLAMAALLFAAFAPFTYGQVESGRFVGRITDAQGAVVPNARVEAINTGTNIVQAAMTSGGGEFVITPVSAGVYTLAVTAPGFEKLTTSNIEVQVGQVVREDLSLRIGAASTTVEVQVETPMLNTDTATVGQVITNEQIVDLPLNGRGFYQLAELTPGAVLLPPTGNVLPIRPEEVDGNTISGIRGRAISFLLDGVDVSEQHQGGTFIQTSIDALQEFSVQQNPYSAEFNRGGGFFNATTKSGTNQLHGGLFEFIRNDKLDARNFFASTRQVLKRNQFGGDIGGPLSIPHLYSGKDKTFFFLDYEGQRLRQGLIFNSIVPALAQRGGDFSGPGLKKIYDPLTTTTAGGVTTRTQFPGNIIPARRFSPQALAIQKYYETPNNPTGTARFTPSQAIDWDQFTTRIDDQVTKSNRLFGRFFYVNNREVDPNAAPALQTASLTSNAYDLALGLITTLGANKVNDFRVHYLPSHIRLSAFLQGPDFNAANGIAGFTPTLRPGTGGSFPDFSFSGYSSLQGSSFDGRPKSQDRKVFEPTDNFTIIHGRHSIKFGTLVRYYQWLGYDSQTYVGNWSFNGSETQNPAAASGTGDGYADFLLGYPFNSSRAYPAENFGGQRWYYQCFAQDDIRLSDRLTLNVGLRYEYSPWLEGYRGQIGTFNPALAKPIIVASRNSQIDLGAQLAAPIAYKYFGYLIQTSAQAGLPYSITYTDRKQFAPRIGFAWSPFGRTTVFRGGYGIFYEPENTDGRVNLNILPFRLNETVFQTQNQVPDRTLGDFFLGSQIGSATTNPSLNPTLTHMLIGYDEHYSFGVQQQLSSKTVADIAYVGNHGVHLNGNDDYNTPNPGPGAVQTRRPDNIFGPIGYQSQDVGTTYQSLQAKLEHRASNGLTGLASYTWSKFLQENQQSSIGGPRAYEKTYSAFDIPQNLAVSFTYELPIGRGRMYLGDANRVVSGILGGWQMQSIIILHTGSTYTPFVSRDVANTGVGGQRPNRNPAGGSPNFKRSLKTWFDKSAYVVAPQYTYGQVRANTLRSDAFRQYDASIFKNFQLREGSVISFRAEFFNLPNTNSFAAPNSTIDVTSGGQVTNTSVPSRDIQLAVKYNF